MKAILLLLSSERSAFPLINYLVEEGKKHAWKLTIGSMFDNAIADRIKKKEAYGSSVACLNINQFQLCDQAIKKADLVIGMLSDALLLKVADSCILYGKTLISPSRLSRQMMLRKSQAEENDTLLLLECGFSPGVDHITAKKAIDNIHHKGGKILSFKTYSGSFIDERCNDNPWRFKLTEPATEYIGLGKFNNRHLINGQLQHIPYQQLFERGEPVTIDGLDNVKAIPEGDSLYYRKIYQLTEANTVIRGKLFRNHFDRFWNLIIKLGLTDSVSRIDPVQNMSFHQFTDSLFPYAPSESTETKLNKYAHAHPEDIEKLHWLGFFEEDWIENPKVLTSASILNHLMEKRLSLKPEDIDSIVMQHQLEYTYRNVRHKFVATLVTKGESRDHSALAKAIGITTGAAVKACLLGAINVKGLHIPTRQEIYDPILNEYDELGITFHVEEKRIYDEPVSAVIERPQN